MGAAIYVRTCTAEKLHHTTRVENQIAYCRQVAAAHNLTVEEGLIFTDIEEPGEAWPSCWDWGENSPSRAALSALVQAIEAETVDRVLVHRMDVLGTSSEVLQAIADMLLHWKVPIVANPEQLTPAADDVAERFALSLLSRCVQVDSAEERKRRAEIREKKQREIDRLKSKVSRLEAELAELG